MNPKERQFDYIIAGAGLSGISLAYAMSKNSFFNDKTILLIDKEHKNKQDKTYSFWADSSSDFTAIAYHNWGKVEIMGHQYADIQSIAPYQYYSIRSIDFYTHCFTEIKKKPNIVLWKGDIGKVSNENNSAFIEVDGIKISAPIIFSSILLEPPATTKKDIYLLQHFMGYTIQSSKDVFTPDTARVMDFDISQQYGTAFMYLLPYSKNKAMLEYTLFTEKELEKEQYKTELNKYFQEKLGIGNFVIEEEEYGVIPMTTYAFPLSQQHIHFIGTASGATKPSTGYTFSFVQKQVQQIIEQITTNAIVNTKVQSNKYTFYDSILLQVLKSNPNYGAKMFTDFFKKNKFSTIFKFLDNETSFLQEINLMRKMNIPIFFKAMLNRLF
jgi:lycopene beta-cyclase